MTKRYRGNTQLFLALLVVLLLITTLAVGHARGNAAASTPAQETGQTGDTAAAAVNAAPNNCRYGVYALYANKTLPWLSTFGAGWYVTPGYGKPSADSGNGAFFYRTVRMKEGTFNPPLSELDADLAQYPGATWLIGNEMEVNNPSTGDGTYPQDYAVAYHDAYTYIKQRDPSAQVGIGAMSMATPGRLQYLDIVWDTYQDRYGVAMPVDVWNIHLYILSEAKDFGNGQGDGKVALGTDPAIAKKAPNGPASVECPKDSVYCRAEHDDVSIFAAQITDLRRWMKQHGQQNKPLIITEWSLLFQPGNKDEFGKNFAPKRVNDYMTGTIAWLESARDTEIGYPADNYRLVQQWAWFSTLTEPGYSGYSSNLLKSDYENASPGSTAALTAMGERYRSETLARSTYVNLKAGQAASVTADSGTAELQVSFRNNGISLVSQPFQVTFYADAALTQVIGSASVNTAVTGCSWQRDTNTASVTWTGLSSGVYNYWAKVDSGGAIAESNENDNVASGVVFVNTNATPTPPADSTAPTVNWVAPVGNGASYTIGAGETAVTLRANASDNVGVARVSFYRWDATAAQWVTLAEDTAAPYETAVSVATLRDGWNQISAMAMDTAGNASASPHIWLVKNSVAEATPTVRPTETPTAEPSATPNPGGGPALSIPGEIDAVARRPVVVPINFNDGGRAIATALFALDLNQSCVQFDPGDGNEDGLPDAVGANLPADFTVSVSYGDDQILRFVITRKSGSSMRLPNGRLLEVTLVAGCEPPRGQTTLAPIPFVTAPPPSFGTTADESVSGATTDGSLRIRALERSYLPALRNAN